VCLDTAFPDAVDDGTDQSNAEQRPKHQCPERERAFAEVDVCHRLIAKFGGYYNKVAVLPKSE